MTNAVTEGYARFQMRKGEPREHFTGVLRERYHFVDGVCTLSTRQLSPGTIRILNFLGAEMMREEDGGSEISANQSERSVSDIHSGVSESGGTSEASSDERKGPGRPKGSGKRHQTDGENGSERATA